MSVNVKVIFFTIYSFSKLIIRITQNLFQYHSLQFGIRKKKFFAHASNRICKVPKPKSSNCLAIFRPPLGIKTMKRTFLISCLFCCLLQSPKKNDKITASNQSFNFRGYLFFSSLYRFVDFTRTPKRSYIDILWHFHFLVLSFVLLFFEIVRLPKCAKRNNRHGRFLLRHIQAKNECTLIPQYKT